MFPPSPPASIPAERLGGPRAQAPHRILCGVLLALGALISCARSRAAAPDAPSAPRAPSVPARKRSPKAPQVEPPAVRRARARIAELGDARFTVRRQAYRALKAMGRAALGPLTEALENPDAEVRTRALRLLIELRGRGFLGIRLLEDWGQQEAVDTPAPGKALLGPPHVLAEDVVRGRGFPAEKAGLEKGDRLLAVNGQPVGGIYDLMREIIKAGPAKPSMLEVERDGRKRTLAVTFTRHPNDPAPPVDLLARPPDPEGRASGQGKPSSKNPPGKAPSRR